MAGRSGSFRGLPRNWFASATRSRCSPPATRRRLRNSSPAATAPCGSTPRRRARSPTSSSCSTGSAAAPDDFDVIHFHTDYLHWPLFRDMAERTVTTLHGRLDLRLPQARLRRLPGDAAGVDLQRPAQAVPGRELAVDDLPRPAARPLALLRSPVGGLPGLRRADLPGEAGRPGDRDCQARRDAVAHRRQDRQVGRGLLRDDDQAAAGRSADRVRRRDQRRGEAGVLRQCPGAAVPHRLAGAVRPGDDRGHGLRHAGRRLQPRLGAGGDRPRRDRFRRRRRGRGGRRGQPADDAQPADGAASASRSASPSSG